jgi:G3E family GTPase
MAARDQRIPVTVLTGFLGSGKTTLLNRILTEQHGQRIAVIENEFGEIGIDHELVINADEEIFEMNNGCICCTVRGDLIRILENLMKRRERFDRILIETTGMAEPGPVAQTFFVDPEMQENMRLDGIVTIVDAHHVEQHFESDEVRTQIAFADVILLNKVDLVDQADQDALERRIRAMNAQAEIYRSIAADVDLGKVLDVGGFALEHAMEIDPKFLEPEYPFEWGGVFRLDPESTFVCSAGPDPAMGVCLVPVDGEGETDLADAVETAVARFSDRDHPLTAPGDDVGTHDRRYDLDLAEGGSFTLAVSSPGLYAIFTEHLPEEFAARVTRTDGSTVDCASAREYRPDHEHDDEVTSVGIEAVGDVDWDRLQSWLSGLLMAKGPDLYRSKGVIAVADQERRFVFQGVHMLLDTSLAAPWSDDEPRVSRLVFIGRDLDRDLLQRGFDQCLV